MGNQIRISAVSNGWTASRPREGQADEVFVFVTPESLAEWVRKWASPPAVAVSPKTAAVTIEMPYAADEAFHKKSYPSKV